MMVSGALYASFTNGLVHVCLSSHVQDLSLVVDFVSIP
jgi:hypothetical protein